MIPNDFSIVIIALIWLHWLSDFVLQSDKMATSKSTSVKWLSIHVFVYSLPFLIVFGWKYALVNFLLHWYIDFFSSKATSYFWKKNEKHWFFVVIGADQAAHLSCLIFTLPLAT